MCLVSILLYSVAICVEYDFCCYSFYDCVHFNDLFLTFFRPSVSGLSDLMVFKAILDDPKALRSHSVGEDSSCVYCGVDCRLQWCFACELTINSVSSYPLFPSQRTHCTITAS